MLLCAKMASIASIMHWNNVVTQLSSDNWSNYHISAFHCLLESLWKTVHFRQRIHTQNVPTFPGKHWNLYLLPIKNVTYCTQSSQRTWLITHLLQWIGKFTKKPCNFCFRRETTVKEGTVCKRIKHRNVTKYTVHSLMCSMHIIYTCEHLLSSWVRLGHFGRAHLIAIHAP